MTYIIYTEEILQEAVNNSISIAGVLRFLGKKQAGGTQTHLRKKIEKFNIDTSHFLGQGHNAESSSPKKRSSEDILTFDDSKEYRTKVYLLRRALTEVGREYSCEACVIGDSWNGKPIVLHVDHINGNCMDNREVNLRYLCPNCHSQTKTYCRKNSK